MLQYAEQLENIMPCGVKGTVAETDGQLVYATGFHVPLGAMARIDRQSGAPLLGEVVGFRSGQCLIYPYEDLSGIRHGNQVTLLSTSCHLPVGPMMIGRVIDSRGRPVDGKGPVPTTSRVPLDRDPPDPVTRPTIDTTLETGVRSMDALLTCGIGQRMGIFAGAGVGKSVLLGMMARNSSADVNVIGLVGERGREVNEFIHRDLGEQGLARSVVVLATSDQPALMRVHAAQAATSVAEYFRDQGKNVLLIMDSLTRVAMAQREIGLSAGEPPTTRGYPPSVFSLLPRLVERAGLAATGSITAYYSVLVEGDDASEPVSDTVRGLIDGHTLLSRDLASRGQFPAIDVLQSISRLMTEIVSKEHREAAMKVRQMLALYKENEDLISIGAYRQGSNPQVDKAIAVRDAIVAFLKQDIYETAPEAETQKMLFQLASAI